MATDWRGQLRPRWMTRDMVLVFSARGFMSAGRSLSAVVVPIYLAQAGFSAPMLGLLFAATAIVSAVISSFVAALSDRIGRKPFLIGVPLLAAVSAMVFAASDVTILLFVFAALGSFGRGAGAGGGSIGPYQPAEQAYIADSVPGEVRNSVFGRMAVASSLGALIGGGPLAFLPDIATHFGMNGLDAYRPAFVAFAALALVAALLPIPIAPLRPVRKAGRMPFSLPRRSWSTLRKLWITNGLNGLAVGFFGPFVTYWFYRRFGAGPGTIGALYTLINLAAMGSSLSAAPLAKRLGIVHAIVISRVVSAVLIVPMVLSPHFWIAGGVYFIRMMVQRVSMPLRQSYVMGVVPPEERGVVAGLSNLPAQATSAASPALAGYLFDHVAMAVPFELGAAVQLLNAGLYYIYFHALRPPEEDEPRLVVGAPDDELAALDGVPLHEPFADGTEPATALAPMERKPHRH